MTDRKTPEIIVERINYERGRDIYDAIIESREQLFIAGFIPNPDLSIDEWDGWMKQFDDLWENDKEYHFQVIETTTNQFVGTVFLNHVERRYQMANLGYWVRISRVGEGIATEAAKLAARYGFEKLGFQRLEIVVGKDNTPSLKIAEKMAAFREGLLRNRLNLHGSPCDAYMHSLIPADYGINKTA